MDNDRIEGKIKETEGKVQDAWGDLTNDPKDDIEGKGKQIEGRVQQEWGKFKDDVRKSEDNFEDRENENRDFDNP